MFTPFLSLRHLHICTSDRYVVDYHRLFVETVYRVVRRVDGVTQVTVPLYTALSYAMPIYLYLPFTLCRYALSNPPSFVGVSGGGVFMNGWVHIACLGRQQPLQRSSLHPAVHQTMGCHVHQHQWRYAFLLLRL